MSEHNGQRLTLSLVILVGALCIVFSPVLNKIVHPKDPMPRIYNLNPGIDIVGGTSLLYKITPPGRRPPQWDSLLGSRADPWAASCVRSGQA